MAMKVSFFGEGSTAERHSNTSHEGGRATLARYLWPEYPTRVIPPSRYVAPVMLLCALGVLAGCASTKVQPSVMIPAADALPRPTRIAVYDFAVAAQDVSPNNAPLSRLRRVFGGSQSEEELKVGRSVADALAAELVKALTDLDLPIERASATAVADGTLAIEGQFVSIDEGNRLRRVIIGFGAGASEVRTHTQMYLGTSAGPRLVEEFETDASSSKKPGAAVGMGAGAAIGAGVAVSTAVQGGLQAVTEPKDTAEADAKRTAEQLAKQIKEIFTARGWTAAKTVK
jgi:hypothetical protein